MKQSNAHAVVLDFYQILWFWIFYTISSFTTKYCWDAHPPIKSAFQAAWAIWAKKVFFLSHYQCLCFLPELKSSLILPVKLEYIFLFSQFILPHVWENIFWYLFIHCIALYSSLIHFDSLNWILMVLDSLIFFQNEKLYCTIYK